MTTKSKWNKRTQCSAINCKNYQCDSTNLAFHRFPKDPDRCARWVQCLRNASLMEVSSQRLNLNYRVCSAHFHATQFKRPSNVHAGLKWDAVPTMIDDPDPTPPLRRQPRQEESPPKKRNKKKMVYPSNADGVQRHTASEAGPSLPPTPVPLPSGLEHALKMKIGSLKAQVCKLRAKLREVSRRRKTRKAGVSKESVMKQMRKLLPARAYAFVSYLLSDRLSQDCLENALSAIRARLQTSTGLMFNSSEKTSCASQDGPGIIVPVDTERIMDEHSYASVITDDPAVSANAAVKDEQVEQPIDYSLVGNAQYG
ncbi:uncharacterized protein LOC143714469 [Siphateles boraxobius]|uniref:uncharacterized protein LOC143714469 n=1 Tax=Siphateles boraxobius TaxID=180520 RepID=UPI0040637345